MRILVDNRLTSRYFTYFIHILRMLLPGRRNGRRDDTEGVAPIFQELYDSRQCLYSRTVPRGIMHEDNQMAVKVRPQFELLFNILNGLSGRLPGTVGIAGQGIPTNFDIPEFFNSRPKSISKVPIISRAPMIL